MTIQYAICIVLFCIMYQFLTKRLYHKRNMQQNFLYKKIKAIRQKLSMYSLYFLVIYWDFIQIISCGHLDSEKVFGAKCKKKKKKKLLQLVLLGWSSHHTLQSSYNFTFSQKKRRVFATLHSTNCTFYHITFLKWICTFYYMYLKKVENSLPKNNLISSFHLALVFSTGIFEHRKNFCPFFFTKI